MNSPLSTVLPLDPPAAPRHEAGMGRPGETTRRFGDFTLDERDRRLTRDGEPVELNARYFDALALMLRDPGALVTKDRFHETVWQGIPVTDEALTQCIRTLRRALGDDAANPTYIETVPKHGYRFVAPVEVDAGGAVTEDERSVLSTPPGFAQLWLAGSLGGAAAGVVGGLVYGFAGMGAAPGSGALSALLVMLVFSVVIGVVAGVAVGAGIAFAVRRFGAESLLVAAGGGIAGLVTGALGRLVGIDAFQILLGRAPGEITGALEGGILGFATGLAVWAAHRIASTRKALALCAIPGGLAGIAIALVGGRMMGGSLAALAERFPDSSLRVAQLGRIFGEDGFGALTRLNTSILEGAVFTACVGGAMVLALRR